MIELDWTEEPQSTPEQDALVWRVKAWAILTIKRWLKR
jgi:hypothetical protein